MDKPLYQRALLMRKYIKNNATLNTNVSCSVRNKYIIKMHVQFETIM
jgi:hypothetical protein